MHRHSALVSHIVAGRMRRKTSTSCDTSSGGGSCPGRATGRSPLHRMHLHPRRLCERSDPTASNWLLDEAELRGGYRGSQGPGAFRGRSASVRSHPRTGQRAISSSQSTTGQDQTRKAPGPCEPRYPPRSSASSSSQLLAVGSERSHSRRGWRCIRCKGERPVERPGQLPPPEEVSQEVLVFLRIRPATI